LGSKSIATVIDPDGPLSQVTAACPVFIAPSTSHKYHH